MPSSGVFYLFLHPDALFAEERQATDPWSCRVPASAPAQPQSVTFAHRSWSAGCSGYECHCQILSGDSENWFTLASGISNESECLAGASSLEPMALELASQTLQDEELMRRWLHHSRLKGAVEGQAAKSKTPRPVRRAPAADRAMGGKRHAMWTRSSGL